MKNLIPPHRSLVLLGVLLAGILSTAFSEEGSGGWIILLVGYVFLGIGSGYLLGANRRWCAAVSILAVAMIALELLVVSGLQDATVAKVGARLCSMGLFGLLLVAVVRYSLLAAMVSKTDRIIAGICGYLLIAFFWSNLYNLIESLSPKSFSDSIGDGMTRVDFLYFSLSSLTTLGYGDVTPVGGPARITSALESVCGVLYLAIFISALVARPGDRDSQTTKKARVSDGMGG